jgi:hypothetical protein
MWKSGLAIPVRPALLFPLLAILAAGSWEARAARCYFCAAGSDVSQPAQKVFLTWDPVESLESFTVQPKFEGSAANFGMVIPTPSRPRLAEAPREFFKELAAFTILKPTPPGKYGFGGGGFGGGGFGGGGFGGSLGGQAGQSTVRVVEAGVVGSLDYKIVTADRPDDLFDWLKQNRYQYAGDEETLQFYTRKKWFFTVMRIDPRQMRRNRNGHYEGEITPTRFIFSSGSLIYPLRITRISVPKATEALFYVQAPEKMDLPGTLSYQYSWTPMLRQALGSVVPGRLVEWERSWMPEADAAVPELTKQETARRQELPTWQPARLEWARKITERDIAMLSGFVRFDRQAELRAVQELSKLRGTLREGQWLTKFRKTFAREEMGQDLQFVPARLGEGPDLSEYDHRLPTSPP